MPVALAQSRATGFLTAPLYLPSKVPNMQTAALYNPSCKPVIISSFECEIIPTYDENDYQVDELELETITLDDLRNERVINW